MVTRNLTISLLLIVIFVTLSCTRNAQLINDSNTIFYHNIRQNIFYFESKIAEYSNDDSCADLFKHSHNVFELIEKYQQDLYKLDGSKINDINSLENPLETEIVHDYMFVDEERAYKLELEIATYQKYLLSTVDNERLVDYIKKGLSTDGYKTKKWGVKSWAEWNFELLPMITTIINLELIKLNVLTIEIEVIESSFSSSKQSKKRGAKLMGQDI